MVSVADVPVRIGGLAGGFKVSGEKGRYWAMEVMIGGSLLKYCCMVVAGALSFLASGCSGVTDTGVEHEVRRGSKFAVIDRSFTYRQLGIDDFQAEALDRGSSSVVQHVQARSCISIQTAADTRVRSQKTVSDGKKYVGTLSNVSYQAVFEPYCSWWNPKVPQKMKAYVLEHEQIHFALTELSARELNKKVRQDFTPENVYGKTAQEVEDKLRVKVRNASKKAIAMSSGDHSAFDKQTSHVYRPKKQQEWLKDVTLRLARTGAYR